ncbi:MAG TPA: sugar phosphate isomerase/epimerase family protein [Chloroflexia bacterium]|nr:sugar phosphate isomerase/epimerase family protein [Chloroflexia bacterium]
MYLAFSTLACPAWSGERIAAEAARLGYAAVEIRLLDGEVLDPAADAARITAAVAACRARGVAVCAFDTSCRLVPADPAAHARHTADLGRWIGLAQALQVPLLRVFGGESDAPEAVANAQAVETLIWAAGVAARAGVVLALETHDAFAAAARVAAVLAQVNSPAAGALWDTLHPYRVGESPAAVLAALGPYLAHVHLKDGQRPAPGGTDWPLVPLGAGDVPLPAILAALHAHGYTGALSFEWEKKWHAHLAEPEVALPAARAWWDSVAPPAL